MNRKATLDIRITNDTSNYDIDWKKVEEIGDESGFEWGKLE